MGGGCVVPQGSTISAPKRAEFGPAKRKYKKIHYLKGVCLPLPLESAKKKIVNRRVQVSIRLANGARLSNVAIKESQDYKRAEGPSSDEHRPQPQHIERFNQATYSSM